jgi:nucleoside-diphosphate-sugar epimerase
MKVLVTGSTGYIGRFVVQRLVEAGHTLRTLDITAQPASKDYEHIPGDVRNLPLVRQVVQGMEAPL